MVHRGPETSALLRKSSALALALLISAAIDSTPAAQGRGGGARAGGPPATARARRPKDFTGYWVAVVTEHWHLRMVMPPKDDFSMLPLNAEARRLAGTWTPAQDAGGNECRSYGAASIMRIPGRLHILWADDNTLQIDTDSGTQTRMLHFGGVRARGLPTDMAGLLGGVLGRREHGPRRAHARAERQSRRRHHEDEGRLPAEERRALQREHDAAGVLRHVHRARRHVVAGRHLDHHGSDVPHRSVRDDESLQEDSRHAGLGPDALPPRPAAIIIFRALGRAFTPGSSSKPRQNVGVGSAQNGDRFAS